MSVWKIQEAELAMVYRIYILSYCKTHGMSSCTYLYSFSKVVKIKRKNSREILTAIKLSQCVYYGCQERYPLTLLGRIVAAVASEQVGFVIYRLQLNHIQVYTAHEYSKWHVSYLLLCRMTSTHSPYVFIIFASNIQADSKAIVNITSSKIKLSVRL